MTELAAWIALAAMATVDASCRSLPERVPLPAATFFVHPYVGRLIELCGRVEAGPTAKEERILYAASDLGDPQRFLIHDPGGRLPMGEDACVAGMIRERAAPSAAVRPMPEGLTNPDHILYPLDCRRD